MDKSYVEVNYQPTQFYVATAVLGVTCIASVMMIHRAVQDIQTKTKMQNMLYSSV